MPAILNYLPYLGLLLLSPIIASYILRYVYPDVRIFVKSKRFMLYGIFGLGTYLPAALLGILGIFAPLSPTYMGQNTIYLGVSYVVFVFFGSSIVEYQSRKRKKGVAIPKDLINYGLQHSREGKKGRQSVHQAKVSNMLKELEKTLKETPRPKKESDEKVKQILGELKTSLIIQRKHEEEEKKKQEKAAIEDNIEKLRIKKHLEEEIGEAVEKKQGERRKRGAPESKAEAGKKPEEEVKGHGKDVNILLQKLNAEIEKRDEAKEQKEKIKKLMENLKEELKRQESPEYIADELAGKETPEQQEHKKNVNEVLEKLKKEVGKREKGKQKPEDEKKVASLMGELKNHVEKQVRSEYSEEDVEGIYESLKEAEEEDKEAEKTGETKGPGHRKKAEEQKPGLGGDEKEAEADLGEISESIKIEEPLEEESISIETHEMAHPMIGEKELMKEVVGDVRSQMEIAAEKKKSEESKEKPGKKWYAGFGKKEEPKEEQPQPIDSLEPEAGGENLELFEEGLTEGPEEDLEMPELEDVDEDLELGDYDGMFVKAESSPDSCPNCHKTGTTIVYCPSCGKSFCSNCAKNVNAKEDSVMYTCPHCANDFAMKRRVNA